LHYRINESGTSHGVSWKWKSSHKLVNVLHLPPLLRRRLKKQKEVRIKNLFLYRNLLNCFM